LGGTERQALGLEKKSFKLLPKRTPSASEEAKVGSGRNCWTLLRFMGGGVFSFLEILLKVSSFTGKRGKGNAVE